MGHVFYRQGSILDSSSVTSITVYWKTILSFVEWWQKNLGISSWLDCKFSWTCLDVSFLALSPSTLDDYMETWWVQPCVSYSSVYSCVFVLHKTAIFNYLLHVFIITPSSSVAPVKCTWTCFCTHIHTQTHNTQQIIRGVWQGRTGQSLLESKPAGLLTWTGFGTAIISRISVWAMCVCVHAFDIDFFFRLWQQAIKWHMANLCIVVRIKVFVWLPQSVCSY